MSITHTDSTTQLAFSMSESPDVYAVLLGSRVSQSAGIPTGWEITLELVRRAGIAPGVGEQEARRHSRRGEDGSPQSRDAVRRLGA